MDQPNSRNPSHERSHHRQTNTHREVSQGQEHNERRSRPHPHRVRSHSTERHVTRFLNIPPDIDSRTASPSRETASIITRDYAEHHASTSPTRSRTRAMEHGIGSSSVRRRAGSLMTASANPSPGPAQSWRGFYNTGRRSVAIAPASTRGDVESRKFTLAGPPAIDSLSSNQTYVDPGYAELNPAYDQPSNVRPVWGLAKPLPRVIRPGMVPAQDELEKELEQEQEDQERAGALIDLEAGRVEPSLRPEQISSTLDTIRREREISLFRAYRHLSQHDPDMSPFSHGTFSRARTTSEVPTEPPEFRGRSEDVIPEEVEEPHDDPEHMSETEFPHLSEAVANMNAAREEADLKIPYEDAVPLPAYDAEDDEIHNLHTYWSVVRLRFREPLAELLAITVQYTLGFSANLVMIVSQSSAGVGDTTDWAWGLSTMIGIYIAGGISGAHLNPAMSLMLYIYRGFPLRKMPTYIAAQLLGAILAALIAYGLFQPGLLALQQEKEHSLHMLLGQQTNILPPLTKSLSTTSLVEIFITSQRHPWVTTSAAFFIETTGTCILGISVLALGDDTNSPPGAGMNAFIVGLLVTLLSICFGYVTGLAMNPVRDFGPRIAMYILGYGRDISLFADGYWFKVAWLGPLTGAVLGGFFYDSAIFVGGESPVNYPAKRIRRAARKWKKRWSARIGRGKRRIKNVKDDIGSVRSGYERLER